jgi:type IV pilus assembly protein PilX
MLLLLTLLGVSAVQTTTMEERMAGNSRDREFSFQAAEAALRAGERLLAPVTLPAFNGTNGYHPEPVPGSTPLWQTPVTWGAASTDAIDYSYGSGIDGLSAQPQFYLEEMPAATEPGGSLEAGVPLASSYFRVTSRAVGGSSVAVVILQTTYKR